MIACTAGGVPGSWESAALADAAQAAAAPHGAIVVALGDGSGPAARALAREVYRDPTLQPSLDEATAAVLAGSDPPQGALKLRDTAELRLAISRASSEVAARRLLASLGADNGAALVVTVVVDGGHATARVLSMVSGGFAPDAIAATVQTAADGTGSYTWPSAVGQLIQLIPPTAATPGAPAAPGPPGAATPAGAPLATAAPTTATHHVVLPPTTSMWKSPWFWGALGGVAAAGLTIFLVSKVSSNPGVVHIDGQVAP